jgi:hypothetical protein
MPPFPEEYFFIEKFPSFLSFPFDTRIIIITTTTMGRWWNDTGENQFVRRKVLVPLAKPQIPQPSNEPGTL